MRTTRYLSFFPRVAAGDLKKEAATQKTPDKAWPADCGNKEGKSTELEAFVNTGKIEMNCNTGCVYIHSVNGGCRKDEIEQGFLEKVSTYIEFQV